MTEEEWLSTDDPETLLLSLANTASNRKLRLFGLLCCRQNIGRLQDQRFRDALSIAEEFVDGTVSASLRAAAEMSALDAYDSNERDEFDQYLLAPAELLAREYPVQTAVAHSRIAAEAAQFADDMSFEGIDLELMAEQAAYARDIFGNPFQPIAFDPSWRTSTAVAIAKGIYESRDFAPMPLLADSLQDVGCADERILDHCRGPGPHVKGCWVVDLVLGKE